MTMRGVPAAAPRLRVLPVAARRQQVFTRSIAVMEKLSDRLTPEVLDAFVARLESALEQPALGSDQGRSSRAELMASLTKETASGAELAALEASALADYFAHRQKLLAGSLSAPEVARLLNTSRQTPHDRVKSGSLLAEADRGGLRFPAWQFDPQGPDGVVAGLPAVVRALAVPSLSKINWLVRPNPYLEGRTPLEALRQGEVERVVETARAVGVS